ncbi:MAG: MarR family winged helix-turn-helix transcriptional regulator, partial [Longimicrobiales bacterium]
KSNVTQLVDRLENDGLVRRIADPNDRRSVLAVVTDLGRERYLAGVVLLAAAERELLAELPAAQRTLVGELLDQVSAFSIRSSF